MKKLLSLALFAIAMTSCNAQTTDNQLSTEEGSQQICERIDASKFKEGISNGAVQVLDVRTPDEYKSGKIADATNINFYDGDFSQKVEQSLKKDVPVYLYCQSGARSQKALKILKDLGFSVVYELQGGYMRF